MVRGGGFRRERPALPAQPVTVPAPLTAAAAQIDLAPITVSSRTFRDLEWQQEAWRHYDICGEYRFVVNRHAAAVSAVRYFMADVDDMGRPGKETKDPKVRALAESIFGNEADKQEAFRVAAINLYVAGECWIVAQGASNPENDAWYVVSVKELRKEAGVVKVKRPETLGGGWHVLDPRNDLLMRCWTPHPRLYDVADSPSRAVLPTLREIERLTMLAFSQIDSRLAIAGLVLMPEDIDFPTTDGKTPVQGLMDTVVEAAKQNLQGAGNAAGVVPIFVGVPRAADGSRGNLQSMVAHLKFDSPITPELEKKLDQALRRLALGLDVAPEELLGQGDANHWGAWQIEESSIKMFIAPAAARLCQALNEAYIRAALKSIGKDPAKFMLWYSTAPLVVRPNRQADALQLSELDIIGNEAVRDAGDWDKDDAPSKEELLIRRTWALVKLNTNLLADPKIAAILGFPEGIQVAPPPPDTGAQDGPPPMPNDLLQGIGAGLPLGPQPGAGSDSGAQRNAIPQQPTGNRAPAEPGAPGGQDQGGSLFASGMSSWLQPAAELLVLFALERANARQLTRANRGQYRDVPLVELHTRVRPGDHEEAIRLLDMAGAFDRVPLVASSTGVEPADLQRLLRDYCAELLVRGYAHAPDLLQVYLAKLRVPRREMAA